MPSSNQRHYRSSSSRPLNISGVDEGRSRSRYQDSPLAGSYSTEASGSVARPQQPLSSVYSVDRGRASGSGRQESQGQVMKSGINSGLRGWLPSEMFHDNTTTGASRPTPTPTPAPAPARDQPSAPKEHPRDTPVSYYPIHGGRCAPKGFRPLDRSGETDYTIYAKPAARKPVQDLFAGLLNSTPPFANDPTYRGNNPTITSQYDIAMAEKQLRIDSLSTAEQSIQKKWAKDKIKNSGVCPEGFSWWTYKTTKRGPDGCKLNGYRCWAGGHLVTHELLVEDEGRFFTPGTDEKTHRDNWVGPVWQGRSSPFPRGGIGHIERSIEKGVPRWRTDPNWTYNVFNF